MLLNRNTQYNKNDNSPQIDLESLQSKSPHIFFFNKTDFKIYVK